MDDIVTIISNYSISMPMIVRTKVIGGYEMLSVHNIMNAGILARLDEGDFIEKENLSDEETLIYVVETNIM